MFQIRDAGLAPLDADFIVDAFESTLPFLAAAGNAGQWGSGGFSTQEGFVQATRDDVAQSEVYRSTGKGERLRIFIAQGKDEEHTQVDAADGLSRLANKSRETSLLVGAAMIRVDHCPGHILAIEALAPHTHAAKENGGFIFLDFLITDHRVEQMRRKGAGKALLEHVKQYARLNRKRTIFLDCWTGGATSLVKYYESTGFESLQDFQIERKDGSIWPGRFMRMNIYDGDSR